MSQILFYGLFIFLFGLVLKHLLGFEQRVIDKIKADAIDKKWEIIEIRTPNESDTSNPFSKFSIRVGFSSNIFGFSGEKIIDKVVILEDNNVQKRVWVRVETVFFIPSKLEWSKKRIWINQRKMK